MDMTKGDAAMNGKKYVILLTELIILCVFCSCNKSDSASKIPQINCEYGYFNYVVPGEDGYYLLCNGLIGFWDGNMNHKATPLCKRPDCSHNTNECSSYIYGAKQKMFYVDGYLYLFSLIGGQNSVNKSVKFPFWKVAADGSSKEVALYTSDIPQKYTVFQNKIYYEIQAEDENGKLICRILCQPLEGGEEEQIWKSSLQNGSLGILQGIGEKLYFSEKGLDPSLDTNDPEFDFEKAEYQKNFYAYQPETGELVRNPDFNGKDGSKIVIRNIYDGKLFYSYVVLERDKIAKGKAEMIRIFENK